MDKQKLKEMLDEGLSYKKIGEKFGCSQANVIYWSKKHGIHRKREDQLSDEELLDWAEKSDSIADLIRKRGKQISGTAHRHFSTRLKDLGWDFSKFKNGGQVTNGRRDYNKLLKNRQKRVEAETLRNFLKREGREEKCGVCDIKKWRGRTIRLQIHHKDKDHTNNSLDNLQFICPNCHTLEHQKNLDIDG